MNRVDRLRVLAAFIRFLEKRLGYVFDAEKEYERRLPLQKYVFIARFFGLDLGYEFDKHIYGPYSNELADDYHLLDRLNKLPVPLKERGGS